MNAEQRRARRAQYEPVGRETARRRYFEAHEDTIKAIGDALNKLDPERFAILVLVAAAVEEGIAVTADQWTMLRDFVVANAEIFEQLDGFNLEEFKKPPPLLDGRLPSGVD